MSKNMTIGVVLAILIAGGAFYGGVAYEKTKIPVRAGGQGGMRGMGMFRGMRNGGGFVGGEILSKDDKSITVKMQDGSTKIVFLADSTTIAKSVAGTKDDLAVGKEVLVTGTANSDGSLTATNVQIRPNAPQN